VARTALARASCLHLVVAAITLWHTEYLDRVVKALLKNSAAVG
jgi:TnpA family transposase